MKIVDENLEIITEYDLTKGYLTNTVIVKEDATPIDNVTKFAWADDDYEEVQMYVINRSADSQSTTNPTLEARVATLESETSDMAEALEMILNGVKE